MRSGVIAQKLGMTRVYTATGEGVPVTVLKMDGCQVVSQKTIEKDGYVALQLGLGLAKVKNVSKAERGHFAVANVEPKRKVAEFRVAEDRLLPLGAEITADHFVVGQFVGHPTHDRRARRRTRGWLGRWSRSRLRRRGDRGRLSRHGTLPLSGSPRLDPPADVCGRDL